MKDREARAIINLLQKRIKQLNTEIQYLKNPHPSDCKCADCEGRTVDYMSITLKNPMNRGAYLWFEE